MQIIVQIFILFPFHVLLFETCLFLLLKIYRPVCYLVKMRRARRYDVVFILVVIQCVI